MSYLVLARKHRPATFAQVVGQEHITQTLAGALASGRLAHAFCFTGPRGVGKTSVARILAKAVNCEHGPTAEPCLTCLHCREIEEGRAVDVAEIDAASNSRVEDVRELREAIRYRPQAARFRVTILDEVHMLSKAAFNALLKTLEEPPEHAVFILATTDVHKVPLTILSRCQRYDFRRLAPRTLAANLAGILKAEGLSLPAPSLALMAREADGSIRDSLSLLDQVLSSGRTDLTHPEVVELLGLVDRQLVSQAAAAVLAGDGAMVLDLVARVYAAGGEMLSFYGALQEHFRNLAAAQAAPEGSELFGLTDEELAELRAQASGVSPETLHEVFDQLARSEELFRRSSHPRLVMEMTLLKLTQVRPVFSLGEVIERLGQTIAQGGTMPEGGAPPRPLRPMTPPPALQPPPAAEAQAAPPPAPPAPPPSPASSPAAPAPPGHPASAEQCLRDLTRYVSHAEPTLASYLGRGKADLSEGRLVITLPHSPLARDLATPDNQRLLAQMAAELWGAPPQVELTLASAPQDEGQQPNQATELARELAEHPAVREAMEVFEAQVVTLDPLRRE